MRYEIRISEGVHGLCELSHQMARGTNVLTLKWAAAQDEEGFVFQSMNSMISTPTYPLTVFTCCVSVPAFW